MNTKENQTLEQKRAKYAFDMINKIKGKNYEKDFNSLISKMPTLILTNGLGNSFAFLFSKGKDHHLATIYTISNWLFNEFDIKIFNQEIEDISLDNLGKIKEKIDQILNPLVLQADTQTYIFATEESLRLLNWLRRFASSMLKSEEQ
ncbi:type III-B CRISPR module-associated protein Cmr5 [Hydrogenothermus marinus]|uniref:CRISPR type III-B/RAMP module-associated protein Cmr5 n=1 Tax=Hydrogenothermus marinus TaxID=133270 RepID=A0A3M0BQ56_9AQUI|nr:type III-B CRISPR module-associated protein Cmr5 [Hydrogenothermus marinus]RMA96968.1 CRISPR-associated Cmr5 family protein [Hydrogenothermus marinus]